MKIIICLLLNNVRTMPSTLELLKEKYEIYGKPYKGTPTDLLNDLTSYQATSCFTLC